MMQIPLQITFRNMDPSPAVEARIRTLAERLEHFHEGVVSCRVIVELQHRHHHRGNLYHVSITLRVPGAEFATSHGPGAQPAHEDVHVAARDAFDSMRRQLEDHARVQRGDVKTHHPDHAEGRICELKPDYGHIESAGRRVYFHRNSVVGADFDRLAIGDAVRFVDAPGASGPQATTVHPIGKHHLTG